MAWRLVWQAIELPTTWCGKRATHRRHRQSGLIVRRLGLSRRVIARLCIAWWSHDCRSGHVWCRSLSSRRSAISRILTPVAAAIWVDELQKKTKKSGTSCERAVKRLPGASVLRRDLLPEHDLEAARPHQVQAHWIRKWKHIAERGHRKATRSREITVLKSRMTSWMILRRVQMTERRTHSQPSWRGPRASAECGPLVAARRCERACERDHSYRPVRAASGSGSGGWSLVHLPISPGVDH